MPPWWFKETTTMRSAPAVTHSAPAPSGRWHAPCRTTDLNPSEVVDLVRRNASVVVQGNHDYAVGTGCDPQCSSAFREMARAMQNYRSESKRGGRSRPPECLRGGSRKPRLCGRHRL